MKQKVSRKMKSLVLFVLFQACFSAEERREAQSSVDWKDAYLNGEVSYDPVELLDREGNMLFAGKRLDEAFGEQKRIARPVDRSSRGLASYISLQSMCTCDSQHEVRDLGDGHYPRYLTVSRCKSRPCLNSRHSCRLLNYMVHVLRMRQPTDVQNEQYMAENIYSESPLPDSLRHKWQLKPVLVAVACVPETSVKE